jgi:hypothetical protein
LLYHNLNISYATIYRDPQTSHARNLPSPQPPGGATLFSIAASGKAEV